ncbi:MAG TPA: redoxin domain-containing protein [Armatimonadetes bacterium]|jgi:peroxiredoxin|nr:redoxin domain-containing protein [Armatimonadota bacterium]
MVSNSIASAPILIRALGRDGMEMVKKRWVAIAILGFACALLVPALRDGTGTPGSSALVSEANASSPAVTVGRQAPDFTLRDPEGKPVRLKDLKGKVVVLSFWATWCPPCRMEMPHLEALQKKYAGKPVKVVGVNTDKQGKALRNWMKARKLTFTVVADADHKVSRQYQVEGFPTLYVVDKKGIVREHVVGFDPEMETNLGRLIDNLLKK